MAIWPRLFRYSSAVFFSRVCHSRIAIIFAMWVNKLSQTTRRFSQYSNSIKTSHHFYYKNKYTQASCAMDGLVKKILLQARVTSLKPVLWHFHTREQCNCIPHYFPQEKYPNCSVPIHAECVTPLINAFKVNLIIAKWTGIKCSNSIRLFSSRISRKSEFREAQTNARRPATVAHTSSRQ